MADQPDDLLQRISELEQQLDARSQQLSSIREQLASLATVDEQTHLLNLNGLKEFVRIALHRLQRHDEPFTLVMVRIPEINDIPKTDPNFAEVVKHTATLLSSGLRALDSTARIGDESFGALLAGTGTEHVPMILARLRTLVTAANITSAVKDYDPKPLFSAIVVTDAGDIEPEQVITAANEGLTEAEDGAPVISEL
jgi:diguanylate cyclase (GGDEF)-like protein